MKETNLYKQENECIVCGKTSSDFERPEGDFIFHLNNTDLYFCPDHSTPFKLGITFGQIQLSTKVVSYLSGLEPPLTFEKIKAAILQIAPETKFNINEKSKKIKKENYAIKTPNQLYQKLNQYIIGQDAAKKIAAVAIVEHLLKINKEDQSHIPEKFNVLFIGPSGSGKTLIANSVSKILNLPFANGDATNYSPTGFQGSDAESIIYDLALKCEPNFENAEKGIVFIDEIDKLASYHEGGKVEALNNGTQATLLKLVEGRSVKIPGILFGEPQGTYFNLSTDKIMFFFGGAFNGLEDIVIKKMGKSGKIGFRQTNNETQYEKLMKNYEILSEASLDILHESLIEYGLMAELVGRVPNIVPLKPLTKLELKDCLFLEDSAYNRAIRDFKECNIDIEFTDTLINEIVNIAYKSPVGTRALNSAINKALLSAKFNLLSINGKKNKAQRIIFDEDILNNSQLYKIHSINSVNSVVV